MDRPWEFNGESVLVFSDVHQRVNWAEAILEKERGNYDKVIFLGDMADSHHSAPEVSGIRQTAAFHRELVESNNCRVLIGNHDLPYAETALRASVYRHKYPLYNGCKGFTRSKSIEYAKEMTRDHWQKCQLFTFCNGWLLSHASIPQWIWMMGESITGDKDPERILRALWKESRFAIENVERLPHAFFRCGYLRGGDEETGGMLWSDWEEFHDNLPYPQVIGHTYSDYVRKIGRSYCIDTGLAYAIIDGSGKLELYEMRREKLLGEWTWIKTIPKLRNDTERAKVRRSQPYKFN